MPVTPDQILQASNNWSRDKSSVKGEDRALANIYEKPPLEDLGLSQEEYYSMDEGQRAARIANVVNSRSGESQSTFSEEPGQSIGPSQNGITDDSRGVLEDWPEKPNEMTVGWDVPPRPTLDSGLSEESKTDNISWTSMMDAYNHGTTLAESLFKKNTDGSKMSSKKALKEESVKKAQTDTDDSKEYLRRQIEGQVEDPESIIETAEIVSKYEAEQQERAGAVFTNTMTALNMTDHTDDVIETLSGNMAMYSVVRDAYDKMGFLDKAWGLARSFVPGMSLKDNLDIGGEISAEEFLVNVKAGILELDPTDRAAALKTIGDQIGEDLPAAVKVQLLETLANPDTESAAEDAFGALAPAMDLVDLAIILSGIGIAGYGTYKGIKAASKIGRMSDDVSDAIGIAAGSRDDKAIAAVGMDKESLNNTLEPFNREWIDRDSLDGISVESRNRIENFEKQAQALGTEVATDTRFLREGWLTKEEEAVALRNVESMLNSAQDVDNVVVVRKGDSIEATFDVKRTEEVPMRDSALEPIRDENDNIVMESRTTTVQETQTFDLKLNEDTQEIELADPGIVKRHLAAKNVYATDDFREIVRTAERLDLSEAKLLDDYRQMWKLALEPVLGKGFTGLVRSFSPKQRKKLNAIDDALMAGDAEGKVYTVNELRAGINGTKFDDSMVESYYHIRNVMDSLYYARNGEARREMILKGQRNWNIAGGEEQQVIKPMTDASAATNSINVDRPKYIYNEETGEEILTDTLDFVDVYAGGKMVVKMDSPKYLPGSQTEVRYAIVDAENVTDLPVEVLNYRAGYVPKINERVGYVVKYSQARNIDGTAYNAGEEASKSGAKAVRFFDNKKEAEAWVDSENRKMVEEGYDLRDQQFFAIEDRQLEKERSVTAMSADGGSPFSGGLYTGSRSQEEILYGTEGTVPTRVNSYESISRALTATSRYVARNEWRLGQEERVLKTANQLFSGGTNPLHNKFNSFDDLAKVGLDTENGRKVRALYDSTTDWLNYPSTEELLFKNAVQGILNKSGVLTKMPGAKSGLHSLKSKDPVGAARSAAFHGLLGFWNPVQLWVQAQGAAVALSMNILRPDRAVKAMGDQFLLQTMQWVPNSDKAIKLAAKSTGRSVDEVKEFVEAWNKTGLKESVLTTADHSAAAKGYGITMGAFRNSADKGLFFYRGGELFNRRLSFSTAYDEWKRANKGKKVDDNALREIVNRSNNLMMNMGKANRASWQKGILGLGTQFQQINARTMETMLGMNGNFTKAERAKIALGQFALYGAAGVPLSSLGIQYLMEQTGHKDRQSLEADISPETVKLYNEGFLGWMTLQVLGADIEIGDRSSLLGGIRRLADDFIYTEGTTADKLFGAFGNVSGRFWGSFIGEYEPLSFGLAENRALDPALTIASPVLSSISSFRNIDKAIFMHNMNRIVDKNWGTTVRKDFRWQEEMSAAIGFRLNEEVEPWKMRRWVDAQKDYEKKVANLIVGLQNQYALKSNTGTLSKDDIEQHKNDLALLYRGLGPNSMAHERVMNLVKQKLSDTKNQNTEAWRQFQDIMANRHAHEVLSWDMLKKSPSSFFSTLTGGGDILQQGDLYEKTQEENE